MAERKRQNLIQELFDTEEKYIDNLKLVFEVGWDVFSIFLKWGNDSDIHQTNSIFQHADQAGDLNPFH